MADIEVFGTFINKTKSGVIARAEQVLDGSGQKQNVINSNHENRIRSLELNSDGSISGEISEVKTKPLNYKNGGYYKSSGDFVFDESYGYITDFIAVSPSTTYNVATGNAETLDKRSACMILYNSSKNRVNYFAMHQNNREITTTSATAYMRVSFPIENVADVLITDQSGSIIFQPQQILLSQTEILNKDKLDVRTQFAYKADARFLFFSDIHGDVDAFKRIIALANNWGAENLLDAVLNGGDTAEQYTGTTPLTWYDDLIPTLNVPLVSAIGNHDAKQKVNVTYSATDIYSLVLKKPLTQLGGLVGANLHQPSNAETNGYNYYYVDFNSSVDGSSNVVRVIVLDCMNIQSYWDETQRQWLVDVLTDAIRTNYFVLIVTHCGPEAHGNNLRYSAIPSNFTSYIYDTGEWELVQDAVTAVQSFIDGGGKFICWLTGHNHYDYFLYPKYGTTVYESQPVFVTRTARCSNGISNYGPQDTFTDADPSNPFRDSFNYITIDATRGLLKILRIGVNMDLRGVPKNALVYDFVNHNVLTQW